MILDHEGGEPGHPRARLGWPGSHLSPGVGLTPIGFTAEFDEFFIAQFLASPDRQTDPARIFGALQYEIDPTVTANSAMLIAVAVIGLGVVSAVRWMLGFRGGARGATLEDRRVRTPTDVHAGARSVRSGCYPGSQMASHPPTSRLS
jgi:hypothetical protein